MILTIISYYITIYVIGKIKSRQRLKSKPFPKLYLRKNGIVFFSNAKHKLTINNAKIMQTENTLYINNNNRVIAITNVNKVYIIENNLYFTACGKVQFHFNCADFFRYFNIEIMSNQFDLNELKQTAILNLLNNLFDVSNSVDFLRYLKIVTKVLMIKITKTNLTIKQNKLKIPFSVTYRLNKVQKHIYVNEK